jgi:hypothetical protein
MHAVSLVVVERETTIFRRYAALQFGCPSAIVFAFADDQGKTKDFLAWYFSWYRQMTRCTKTNKINSLQSPLIIEWE